jgi:esterase/lipase superfamily enzyme
MVLATSLSTVADVQSSSRCRPIAPIVDQINLFDSATAQVAVRQIEKGKLGKRICSFEEKNNRYRIQLQLSVAWVEVAQFRRAIVPAKQTGPKDGFKDGEEGLKDGEKGLKDGEEGFKGRPKTWGTYRSPYRKRGAPEEEAEKASMAPPQDSNRYVGVLYATNRVITNDSPSPPLTSITYGRSPTVSFGSALVRVPEAHNIGNVERPMDITIFGFTVFKESENEKKHFTLKEIRRLDRNDVVRFLKANSEHSALVFVHGFNTQFDYAIFETAQIAFDTHFHGVPIAFAWPSEGNLSITGYNYDHDSASNSWDALLQLFHLVRDEAGITNIYVIAHSMGNQILLEALAHAHNAGDGIKLSEIIMASPDVARDVFINRISELRLLAGGLTLYASSADKAMSASRSYSDSVRAGDIPHAEGPVIAPGLDTIDVTALGNDPFGFNHAVFSANRSVLDDIGRIISGTNLVKRLSPGERSPQLIAMPGLPPPTYWRYPN